MLRARKTHAAGPQSRQGATFPGRDHGTSPRDSSSALASTKPRPGSGLGPFEGSRPSLAQACTKSHTARSLALEELSVEEASRANKFYANKFLDSHTEHQHKARKGKVEKSKVQLANKQSLLSKDVEILLFSLWLTNGLLIWILHGFTTVLWFVSRNSRESKRTPKGSGSQRGNRFKSERIIEKHDKLTATAATKLLQPRV